jgi:hypothetical protein
MRCREYKSELIELARGGASPEAARHAEQCHECALFLEEQWSLTEMELRVNTGENAPAYLQTRLLDEFVRTRRPAHWRLWPAWVGAAAAAILLAWWIQPRPLPPPKVNWNIAVAKPPLAVAATVPAKGASRRVSAPRPMPDGDPPFVQIPYTQPLAPWERSEVMRMEMPAAALIAAGLPMAISDPAAQAKADVLVGEDGRPRAVRLISISEGNIEQ